VEGTILNNSNLRLLAVSVALMLALSPAANAQTVTKTIDDFSQDQSIVVNGTPSGVKSNSGIVARTGSSLILGDERDVVVTRTSNNAGVVSLDTNQSIAGDLVMGNNLGTTGDALLIYDGIDNDASATDYTGLGNLDFTASGGDSFYLKASASLSGTVTFTVYKDATNYSIGSLPLTTSASVQPYLLSFSSFTVGGGTGADFTKVGAFTARIENSSATGQISVDFISVANTLVVPEPGAFAYWGMVSVTLAGLMAYRSRFVTRKECQRVVARRRTPESR